MESVKNSASFSVTQAQRGYSRFQVTGMIEWGKKSKPKKIPWASNKPKKITGPKLLPKKSGAEFPSHNKNFQEA